MAVLALIVAPFTLAGCEQQPPQPTSETPSGDTTDSSQPQPSLPQKRSPERQAIDAVAKSLGEACLEPPEAKEMVTAEFALEFEKQHKQQVDRLTQAERDATGRVQEAMKPLDQMIQTAEGAANAERATLINISISRPREMGGGYVGTDSFSGREVYVETTSQRPEQLGNTLALGPLQGQFQRDGIQQGTNTLGALIEVPKLVDPNGEAQSKLQALVGQRRDLAGVYASLLQRTVIANRDAWNQRRDSVTAALISACDQKAKAAATLADAVVEPPELPEAASAEFALEFEKQYQQQIDRLDQTERAASEQIHEAIHPLDQVIRAVEEDSAGRESRARLASLVGQRDKLAQESVTLVERTAKANRDAWSERREALISLLAADTTRRMEEVTSLAEREAREVEGVAQDRAKQVGEILKALMAKPNSREEIRQVLTESGEPVAVAVAELRLALERTLSDCQESLGRSLQGESSLRDDVMVQISLERWLQRFDDGRKLFVRSLRESVAAEARAAAQRRQVEIGAVRLSEGFSPKWFSPQQDRLLVLGDSLGTVRSRLCVVTEGKLSGCGELPKAVRDEPRLSVKQMGPAIVVRNGERTDVLRSDLSVAGTFLNLRPEDQHATANRLLLTGTSSGDRSECFLWSFRDSGDLVREAIRVKPGLLADGDLLMFVVEPRPENDFQHDQLIVLDTNTSQPSQKLAPALARIRDYDLMKTRGDPSLKLHIGSERVWVFAQHGVEGVSDGPTIVDLRPDGTYGSPLLKHTLDYQTQRVGSQRVRILDGDQVVLGSRGAIIVGDASDDNGQRSIVVMLAYGSGKELWSERFEGWHNPRDLAAEALRRHEPETLAVLDPVTQPPSTDASANVTRLLVSQEHMPIRSVAELSVRRGDRIVSFYRLESDAPLSLEPQPIPAFAHNDWVYFGDSALDGIPLR